MKSGLGKIFLKFLHALTMSFLLLNFNQKYKFSNKDNMVSAWRNIKNIFPRPLFTIIFRPEIIEYHPYSILTGDTMVGFVIFCVLNTILFSYSLLESTHGLTTSQLFVESADQSNTGNYSCSSDAGHSNTTAIHVITGKMIYT